MGTQFLLRIKPCCALQTNFFGIFTAIYSCATLGKSAILEKAAQGAGRFALGT